MQMYKTFNYGLLIHMFCHIIIDVGITPSITTAPLNNSSLHTLPTLCGLVHGSSKQKNQFSHSLIYNGKRVTKNPQKPVRTK